MKPLEFKIIKEQGKEEDYYFIVFMYENGLSFSTRIATLPKGLELNKHYFIGDLYGEPVVDDRKGL